MDCQNQYLTLEVQNLQLYISQLLEEKAKDKLAFQVKVQGLTKAHVATILDEKKSASENKNLKMELADQATVKDLMVKRDAIVASWTPCGCSTATPSSRWSATTQKRPPGSKVSWTDSNTGTRS